MEETEAGYEARLVAFLRGRPGRRAHFATIGSEARRHPAAPGSYAAFVRARPHLFAVDDQVVSLVGDAVAQGTAPAQALNCWHRPVGARSCADAVASVLARLGMERHGDTPAGNLSHGQQRRLEVGMALAARPKAIFLDEPTSGMGIDDLDDMKRLIQGLKTEHTVVLIEHNMNIVMDISDTVTVMQLGRVLAEGLPHQIRSDDRVRAAYLGNMITGGKA